MDLILLGTGTGFPLTDRGSPSIFLRFAGKIMLFDIGPGTLRQLSRVGMDHDRIDKIFITHFHPDHTADLIHFLFATRHPPVLEKRKPFEIVAAEGFREFLNKVQKAYGKWLNMSNHMMKIRELPREKPEMIAYDTFRIVSQPVDHTPQSIAFRFEDSRGRCFVYSGDTGFCDEIIDVAKDCDLLILECAFPDKHAVAGHLTPSAAGRVATLAKAKKLLLTHFYPEVLSTDIASDCRKTYKGELVLGRDLLHIRW